MKAATALSILAGLILLVGFTPLPSLAYQFPTAWVRYRTDWPDGYRVEWPFTYQEPLPGDGFALSTDTGQIFCRWVGTPEQNCDCTVAWEEDDGYGQCHFDEGDPNLDLMRLHDDPLTCTVKLRWEVDGRAHLLSTWTGRCADNTTLFLPSIQRTGPHIPPP